MELFKEIIPQIRFWKHPTGYCVVCQDHTPMGGVWTQDGHTIIRIWHAGEEYGVTQCRKCGTIYISTYGQKVNREALVKTLMQVLERHGGVKV